jgi:hypothetical protein
MVDYAKLDYTTYSVLIFWQLGLAKVLIKEEATMITRIMLSVVIVILAVCFLPVPVRSQTVSLWTESSSDYTTYNWAVDWYGLTFFSVLIPENAHFASLYCPCGWAFDLSRYGNIWERYLESPPSDYMWAYYCRTAPGTPPSVLTFALTTSAYYETGIALYGVANGSGTSYGPTMGPIVPELPSMIVLMLGALGIVARRWH